MKIPFEPGYREKYHKLLEDIFESNFLSEGAMVERFEEAFGRYIGMPCLAVTNGGAGLLSIFEYIGVQGKEVVVPANTFWATAVAAKRAGANVIYADCNRDDLCLSLEDLKKKVTKDTKAVAVVHIGGHIAFEVEGIAAFCKERGIALVEDCAHVHGGEWNGKTGGAWGLAGSYSFYATKTMPTGEGGIVCSKDEKFLEWLGYYRNYGKSVEKGKVAYKIKDGFNFRMNEITAAFGLVQLERLPMILEWKRDLAAKYDGIFENRVKFPSGMSSGYYKYIVFDYALKVETGKVFAQSDFGPEIENIGYDLPNSRWVAEHHSCPPIFYGWEGAGKNIEELKGILLR
ncbi:MAG: aminotransferase class V-fold PLP-dependent enzyme [Nitrospirae bacterium]|nr:aminotransferase class V-fold PLP-dependent enzyme [Nitrospirota bacterium]